MSRSEQQHIDEEQALRCRRLLLAVVDQAVRDACLTPLRTRPQEESLTAIRFLFEKDVSGLTEFATWLDFDANVFRTKLLEKMRDSASHQAGGYTPPERRAFRFNYTFWVKHHHEPNFYKKERDEKDGHPKVVYTTFVGKNSGKNNEPASPQEGKPVRGNAAKSPRKQSGIPKEVKEKP